MKYGLSHRSFIFPSLAGLFTWLLGGNFALGVSVFSLLLMPALIGLYVPYARDNPKGLWFKRKLYGWGWAPVTWQGWLITAVYVGLVSAFSMSIGENPETREVMFMFVLPTVLLTVTFIRIAYKKGEPPRWTWGVPRKK